MLNEGDVAPDFTLPADDGSDITLSALRGRKVVLYFYPKDDTPGCTRQACDIRDRWADFERKGAVILGVSPDPVESHIKFRDKYGLPFRLLSDTEHRVAEDYNVWKEKSFMGKKFMGNERTTFIIGEDGRILRILPNVSPADHADQVLAIL